MALKFDGTKLVDGGKTFANVKGDKIYEGMNQSKILFKTSDAAKKIGSTSQGPLTAALWYLFCR